MVSNEAGGRETCWEAVETTQVTEDGGLGRARVGDEKKLAI